MENQDFVVICPYCNEPILIEKINCAIFRHGVWKQNGQQIPPHAAKDMCEQIFAQGLIYGCGKPFRKIAIKCEYI